MSFRFFAVLATVFGISFPIASQPPPEVHKTMEEINSRPRYFWCTTEQAQLTLKLTIKVDGRGVGLISIPVAKAKREEIPAENPKKVAEYYFELVKRGKRQFRGVSHGLIEGNFWVGLATDTEINLGHSWVCGDQIVLHELLPFTIGKQTTYNRSGVQIRATWSKP